MSRAISEGSCDLVGVGRPLTAEFTFASDITSGKTARAKPNHIFEAIQTAGSYLQLIEVRRFLLSVHALR